MYDYQKKGYNQYGASMGRDGTLSFDTEDTCFIRAVPIDSQGYDPGGAYWGTPSNLYMVQSIDTGECRYFRVNEREDPKSKFSNVTWNTEYQESDLADFLQAYIECALWSSTDNADDSGGEPLDANYTDDDIAPDAMASMQEDCASFLEGNAADIGEDYSQAGHDFWLTRNRHGAGFWDRGLGAIGDRLTEAAHAYGSVDLYVGDDGKIYSN